MANISAVRNTCFALISAVEVDLRELIVCEDALRGSVPFLPADARNAALARYEFDSKESLESTSPRDVDLLPYIDFGDTAKVLRAIKPTQQEISSEAISALALEIERFVPTRNRVCHSRPLEEEDFANCLDFAKGMLSKQPKLPWKSLRETRRLLEEDPGYVIGLQIPEYWQLGVTPIRHNLPLPDYDETGFLGRSADRSAVRKHLLASHHVLTIVGEGGVGKSALAIQCLYDLLDLAEHPPFDGIIWTSLKTKTLTAAGVSEIHDAISSTLGIIQAVAVELGSTTPAKGSFDEAIEEILEYMQAFKILLVIDNFETVTDQSLRPLLTSIPTGSKVLLTSRIGLGEIEIRYKLDPLDLKTSVNLLRRFSRSLNVDILYSAAEKKLEKYSQHLYFNPLLIKWYAQSVSLGSDPEKLISRGNVAFDQVIRYCFENLFSRLADQERKVLHFLAAARRPLTPTELLFLMQNVSQIQALELDRAISTLHSSSMLKRSTLDGKSRDGTLQLSLTDVSLDYISRFAPPDKSIFEKIQQASRKLNQQIQQSSVRQAAYKFDLFAVRASTRDQKIAAFHLNAALLSSKKSEFVAARKSVDAAKTLLPTFAETYRVSSLIESKDNETYKALQEIEEAAQLEPDSALIHYQFANFLANTLEEYDRALEECTAAIACDPHDDTPLTLKALVLTRLGRYQEAVEIYECVLATLAQKPKRWRISTRDQAAECYRRFSEQDRATKNSSEFELHIARACSILDEALAVADYDHSTSRLYCSIIEDALFYSLRERNEPYGVARLAKLTDVSQLLTLVPFKSMSLEKVETTFGAASSLGDAFQRHLEHCGF